MKILLILPGTYPYTIGGVSTWAHNLVSKTKWAEFDILTTVNGRIQEPAYEIPKNVRKIYVIKAEDDQYTAEKHSMSDDVMEKKFLPSLERFLDYFLSNGSLEAAGRELLNLHELLLKYGSMPLFKNEIFRKFLKRYFSEKICEGREQITFTEFIRVIRPLIRNLSLLGVRLKKYDLIHSALAGTSGFLGIIQKQVYGSPYLLTEHAVYFRERLFDLIFSEESLSFRRLWKRILRRVVELNYRFADKIVTNSYFNIYWERELGAEENKLLVIRNGVDLKRFKPIPGIAERWSIVSVMRIDVIKDPLNLIRSMQYVIKRHPRARCYIYGPIQDQAYHKECMREIKALGLNGFVRFMGCTKAPEIIYNRGWLVVHPSMSEGAPMAILEAMACGRPVVATDVGGVREILGDSGLLVPPKNPIALANAIVKILSEESLAVRLGASARRRVERLYSAEEMVYRYWKIYRQLIKTSASQITNRSACHQPRIDSDLSPDPN